jgi:membrane fusion protein (multidrug efflux system)
MTVGCEVRETIPAEFCFIFNSEQIGVLVGKDNAMSNDTTATNEQTQTPAGNSDQAAAPTSQQGTTQKPGAGNGEAVSQDDGQKPGGARNGDNGKQNGNGQGQQKSDENKKPRPAWVRPVLIGAGILVLVIAIPWGLNFLHYSRTHVSTDDAYVTGNLVSVSPIISGTLQQLTVDEGYYVHRGELIGRLDPAGPLASLRQAQANYKAAMSQIPQAERNLLYQQQATQAAIRKAQASLAAQKAKTTGAEQQVALTAGTTRNQVRQAQAQIQQASAVVAENQAQVQSAQANVENYRQAVQTALASLQNYQQQVDTAQKAVEAAQARVRSAQADVDRTTKDEARYSLLYSEDAVAAQVYDNARAAARNALAALQADQAQVEQAQSQVEQARASVRQAQSQVEQARKNVAQGEAVVRAAQRAADAAQEQVRVQRAGLGVAEANLGQVGIQQANLISTSQQTGESEADIITANAGQEQVAVRRTQIQTYRAQAQQALAALNNAQVTYNDTFIYAPNDGIVVRKSANIGAALAPGQNIVTITQGQYVWVEANYKETQLADVVPGEPAEVEVDAFPGKVFKGYVHSINEATGAATSLLPPDNATGNFTKVVQRVPVRIELRAADDNDDPKYARQKDLINLRQGMSVNATIDISDAKKYKSEQPGVNGNGSENNGGQQGGRVAAAGGANGSASGAGGGGMTNNPGVNDPAAMSQDGNNPGALVGNPGGLDNSGPNAQRPTPNANPSNMMNGQNGMQNGGQPGPNAIPNPGMSGPGLGGQNGANGQGVNGPGAGGSAGGGAGGGR